MFKEQEEKLLNIVRNGISGTNAHLERLIQEISDHNIRLNDLNKEIETSAKYRNIGRDHRQKI